MVYRTLALVTASFFVTTSALAQGAGGLYAGIVGGVQLFNDNEDGGVDIEYDPGGTFGGFIGKRFGDLRVEGELSYQFAGAEDSDNVVEADFEVLRLTANFLYDIPLATFTPYVGAGFGFANAEFSGDVEDDDNGLTLHGEFGSAFPVGTSMALVPAYRFEWIDTDAGGLDDAQTAHAFRLGLRFDF